jgi:hypothetical protein
METEIKIRKNFESLMLVQQRMSGSEKGEQQCNREDTRNPERYYLFIYLSTELLTYLFTHSLIYSFILVHLPAPLLQHVLCISDSTYQRPLNCSAQQSSLPVPAINISRVRLNRLTCKRNRGSTTLCSFLEFLSP